MATQRQNVQVTPQPVGLDVDVTVQPATQAANDHRWYVGGAVAVLLAAIAALYFHTPATPASTPAPAAVAPVVVNPVVVAATPVTAAPAPATPTPAPAAKKPAPKVATHVASSGATAGRDPAVQYSGGTCRLSTGAGGLDGVLKVTGERRCFSF